MTEINSTKGFVRNKEDFVCEHCGHTVKGNGYTNHCPQCLWSKHVDIMPGDRASTCGGMMRPVNIEGKTNHHSILHVCEKCGHQKKNKVGANDSIDAVVAVVKDFIDKSLSRPSK